MKHKNNIHLSKNELSIIINSLLEHIKKELVDQSDWVLNLSQIKLIKSTFIKVNEKHRELGGKNLFDIKIISDHFESELCEKSRDKMLKFNNDHIVKTDFIDFTDFNRWEKIRTYEKKTI